MCKYILPFVLIIFSTHIFADNGLMEIHETDSRYDATEYMSFYQDSTLSLSFKEISDSIHSPLFIPVKKRFINFGTTSHAYWFRFDAVNYTDNNFYYLDIDYAPLNKVTVFLQDEQGDADTLLHSGLDIPGKYFLQDRSAFDCPLPLEKGKIYRIYIRVQTSSYLLLPVSVMSSEVLMQKSKAKNGFIFLLLGIIIAAFIFNSILFVLTRETTYILLSVSLFLMLISAMYQFGIEISPAMHPWLKSRMRIFTFGLFALTFNLFTIHYLDLAKYRFLYTVFRSLTLILIIYTAFIILPLVPNVIMNTLSPYVAFIIIFIYLITAIFTLLKKKRTAVYFLSYIIGFLIASFIWLLLLNNKIEYNLYTYHANLISSSLFGVLLTLGLVEKFTALKKEEEKNVLFQTINKQLQSEINERKIIEKDLRESNEKFRLLFNLSPQPIAFTDYVSGRIIDFNDKLLEITGYKESDILNKTTVGLEFIDLSAREKILSEIQEKGIAEGIEISFPTPAQGLMHFLLFSTKIKLKGEEKLITSLLDITENRQQFKALQQSEKKLFELNATKDKFFSIIGHDMMNPINALLGFSEILIDALKNNEKADSQEYASIIQQSAKGIYNLLQNLLIWSKTQNGSMDYNPILTNFNQLLANTLMVLEPNARGKEIDMHVETDENLNAVFDNNMISTVIRNLTMNAIKYTDKGGTITLKANIFDNRLNFSISDTGTGISEQQLSQLFKPDKTYSAKGTNDETGTGLGLIICKEFIDIHNGEIRAESTPGKGSTFYFSIPAGLD